MPADLMTGDVKVPESAALSIVGTGEEPVGAFFLVQGGTLSLEAVLLARATVATSWTTGSSVTLTRAVIQQQADLASGTAIRLGDGSLSKDPPAFAPDVTFGVGFSFADVQETVRLLPSLSACILIPCSAP